MHSPELPRNCQHLHSDLSHLYTLTTSSKPKNMTISLSQTVSSGFSLLLLLPVPLLSFCSLLSLYTSPQENTVPMQQVSLFCLIASLWCLKGSPVLPLQHSTYMLHFAVAESRKPLHRVRGGFFKKKLETNKRMQPVTYQFFMDYKAFFGSQNRITE